MTANKHIERGLGAAKIFDNRSLDRDYKHLSEVIKQGMQVLDVGCGTGSISNDVAEIVGESGRVTGIDNTQKFIESGRHTYNHTMNLRLIHSDLFDFQPEGKFDLIMSARTLQWLSNPLQALMKMKSMLKKGGMISVLDYNHEAIEWNPRVPKSMLYFYEKFLRWRADAGMNNHIANDLASMMEEVGLQDIKVINSDEHYTYERTDFQAKVGIWSQVAASTQMVEEAYIEDSERLNAIRAYNEWLDKEAISMTMKLNEVRGLNT